MPEWNLQEHGDVEERKWWPSIEAHFPKYEVFWREHVVPLTCRIVNPSNIFMRPGAPDRLRDLGNTNYFVFWHLAGAHENLQAADWSVNLQRRVYGLYGHLVSAGQDACRVFLKVTRRILDTYGPTYIPDLDRRLCRYGDEDLPTDYRNILEAIKVYRKRLVHLGIFVIIEGMVPRREWLVQYDDLGTVMEILGSANREQIIAERFVNAGDQCRSHLEELEGVLDRIWTVVLREFEEIADLRRYREDQSRVSDADRVGCQWTQTIRRYMHTSGSGLVTPSGVVMFPPDVDHSPEHR